MFNKNITHARGDQADTSSQNALLESLHIEHNAFVQGDDPLATNPLNTPIAENDPQIAHTGIQHIGFKLHTEEFLLPMEPVREIIMLSTITYVPRSDPAIEGIIALRGEIMPVLNLRRILHLPRGTSESTTRVIILHCDVGGFGIIVDAITEFVWLQETDSEPLDQNFFGGEYQFLSGVAKVGDKMRGVIDVLKLTAKLLPEGVSK